MFIYDHILHRGRKQFCCYCLQAFSEGEILKHIKGCFKIKLVNKELQCLKQANTLNLKIRREK